MDRQIFPLRRRHHLVREGEPPHLLRLLLAVLVVYPAYLQRQVGGGLDGVPTKVGHKAGVNLCAVRILDLPADADGVRRSGRDDAGKAGREEEKVDVPRQVEADDLREDGEWRVVHDDAAVGIVEELVVGVWPERPHRRRLVEAVAAGRPVKDCPVDVLGRIAIIRRLLSLELLEEFGVFVKYWLDRQSHLSSPPWGAAG